jgi:hypothetical protein
MKPASAVAGCRCESIRTVVPNCANQFAPTKARTSTKAALAFAALLALASPAQAFEVAEFKSGMAQNEVKRLLLADWNFDRVEDTSDDVILAYDTDPSIARRYQFRFCKGKLVGFEQDVRPSLKALIITTNNYNNQYGQPARVYSNTHIVSNGEKAVFALFWRNGGEYIGVKYIVMPDSEQMSLAFDDTNLCYGTPRF